MQTIAFGVDKQWDFAVEHRELYPVTCDGTWWRIMWEKEYIYDWVPLLHNGNWQSKSIIIKIKKLKRQKNHTLEIKIT